LIFFDYEWTLDGHKGHLAAQVLSSSIYQPLIPMGRPAKSESDFSIYKHLIEGKGCHAVLAAITQYLGSRS
jgi:hypothetical protein